MSKCFTKEDGSSNPMIICISFGRKHQFCLIIVTVNWSSRWQLDAKSILASSSPLLRETAENWRFFLLFRNCVINPDPCPWNWGLTRPTNKWKWVCPFPASRCIFIRLVTENFDEGVGIHGEHSWCLYTLTKEPRFYLDNAEIFFLRLTLLYLFAHYCAKGTHLFLYLGKVCDPDETRLVLP